MHSIHWSKTVVEWIKPGPDENWGFSWFHPHFLGMCMPQLNDKTLLLWCCISTDVRRYSVDVRKYSVLHKTLQGTSLAQPGRAFAYTSACGLNLFEYLWQSLLILQNLHYMWTTLTLVITYDTYITYAFITYAFQWHLKTQI